MIALLAFAACTPAAPEDSTDAAVDLRLGEDDYPAAGADQALLFGPEVTVEAGADVMYCQVGTYEGPDVGIHEQVTYQNEHGHHIVLMGMVASELDHPDGELFECTTSDQLSMTGLEPIALSTSRYVGGVKQEDEVDMPDGMAVKLDEGQRFLVQAHYLNTGTEAFLARDAILLTTLPEDEVATWAAPLVLNSSNFVLPAGQPSTESFDCVAESDWNALYFNAHMHEWGTSFSLERVLADGNESILDIATWEPYFRDVPPTEYYAPGAFALSAGDVLRTTCNWFNDTDDAIEFPHEMCVAVGLVYPQLNTVICDD